MSTMKTMSGWRRRVWAGVAAVTLATAAPVLAGEAKVDSALPDYKPVQGVEGKLKSIGSDTLNNLMTLWAEGFKGKYPNVQPEIEGKGSSTAPPALIAGTAQFGPMSREMKAKEIDDFEKEFGYKPTAIATSLDMLAVYVHKDNPLKGLTVQQIDAIFSKTLKGGYGKQIVTWGDLGLTGEWKDKPISLYGRNSASGTYGYFKEHALAKGDYRDDVKEQPGSSAVVQAVATDKFGMGYSGIGYKTSDVRALPLSSETGAGAHFVEAEAANAYSGEYPLARFLYLSLNYKPGSQLDDLRREFVRYVFSREGQEVVLKDGYLPVPAAVAREELKSVGITPGF